MRAYTITPGEGIGAYKAVELDRPEPGRRQVLVRMHAASLNFRDILLATGSYPGGPEGSVIPLSDGAGEIVAIGPECGRWREGDRVAGAFMQGWVAGDPVDEHVATGLGGQIDGVLTQYRVFDEDGLVAIPEGLSFAEAATLPCAAVTAWNALYGLKPLRPGQTVLTLGTGGVSIFALQLAHAAGARVIVTSSSDDKLARARELGAWRTVNYRSNADWHEEVRRLTDGRGVDITVETAGPGTLARSIAATRRDGIVQMVGVLELGEIDPLPILTGGVIVRGILVGSAEMFAAMNRCFEANAIKPVIDRVFDFEAAPQALEYLASGQHVGKVVINIA